MREMAVETTTVLVMAAGTGGHVFPALSIAEVLKSRSVNVEWLGTPEGMENKLLENCDIKLHQISVRGLRGAGLQLKFLAPFMLIGAFIQSIGVIRRVNPHCVLGMGGFVCGPAGVAAKLMRKPLLIHEQNAVAGLTNRLLSKIANRVFEAFPGTFTAHKKVRHTGNPLRQDIVRLHELAESSSESVKDKSLHILILGGSQGAATINQLIPELLINWHGKEHLKILHQTGSANLHESRQLYQSLGLDFTEDCRVVDFIEDMATAYKWADLVICRSGASTVSELAAAGKTAILIPYPYHRDQQQTLNAQWLSSAGAGYLLQQADLSAKSVLKIIAELDADREKLVEISRRARAMAICDASEVIAMECMEFANVAH